MQKFQANKAKLKREDFITADGWFDETVKLPGSMHEQQYQVSDCEDTNIIILDPSACVYLDNCKYCFLFVGPCEASIFLRNCTRCVIVGISRQLRTRDCVQCKLAIWCESQPVIESSRDMVFSCFPDWGYNLLKTQFGKCNFSTWNNNWWDIYDFTKNGRTGIKNYKLVPQLDDKTLRKEYFKSLLNRNSIQFSNNIVPKTHGELIESSPQTVTIFAVEHPFDYCFRGPKEPRLIKARASQTSPDENQLLGLSKSSPIVYLQFLSSEAREAQTTISKNRGKIVKRLQKVSDEDYFKIFVPFKDQH